MKLSQEEQKKLKLENYKLISAISGKSINELMNEEYYNDNYPNNDCRSKEIILRNLYNPCTSRQLFELVKYQGYEGKYKTIRSLLVRYQRAGFIKKLNNEKPIIYGLTDFGIQNAKNPKMLRERCIRKYHEFQNEKLAELINNDPERFKEIYKLAVGVNSGNTFGSVGGSGSGNYQYLENDFGNRESRIEEMREKIKDDGFLQDLNLDKIEELVKLGDTDLLTDFYINLNDYHKRQKGPMVLQREHAPSKPEGLRDYYTVIVKATNHLVSKPTYEKIPFRFISVGNKQELRLKSTSEAGTYRNNRDAVELGFEYVNSKYFYNRMSIIMKFNSQKKEYMFYYAVVDGKGNCGFALPITAISYNDYEKVQKQIQGEMKLKIIPQK